MTVLYFCFTFGVDFLNSMFDLTVLQKQTDKTPSFYNLPFGSLALLARFLPIDMPAIMLSPKSYAIAIISISLGLPLLLILIFRVCKLISEGDLFVLLVMLITIVFAVSHAAVGAITEMNSYPCIFFTVCLLLPTLNPILGNKLVYPTSIVFYLIASVITGIHKYSIIIDSNRQADIIVESIIQQTKKYRIMYI